MRTIVNRQPIGIAEVRITANSYSGTRCTVSTVLRAFVFPRNPHLALVGRTDPLFADDAAARLHKLSLGLPRALNNAAIAALIAAATAGKALVDDECAKRAAAELTRE